MEWDFQVKLHFFFRVPCWSSWEFYLKLPYVRILTVSVLIKCSKMLKGIHIGRKNYCGRERKQYLHRASSYLPAEALHCSLKLHVWGTFMLKLPVQTGSLSVSQSHSPTFSRIPLSTSVLFVFCSLATTHGCIIYCLHLNTYMKPDMIFIFSYW